MISYKVTHGNVKAIYQTRELAIIHALTQVCNLMKSHTNVSVTQTSTELGYSWKVTTDEGDDEIDVTAII